MAPKVGLANVPAGEMSAMTHSALANTLILHGKVNEN